MAGKGLYTSQQEKTMSDLVLANVEALASSESIGDCSCCAIYFPEICKDWRWGGCIGRNTVYEV